VGYGMIVRSRGESSGVQPGRNRAAGAGFCLRGVKRRQDRVEGGLFERDTVWSCGVCARDRAIAREEV
jgi:hypothetical protein